MEAPLISIIIPCYNGQAIIASCLEEIDRFIQEAGPAFDQTEIIVVNDGSTDETAQRVALDFSQTQLISLPENQGKGAAVRAGMLAAQGEIRLFVDADLPFGAPAIGHMVAALRESDADVAFGMRSQEDVWPAAHRSRLRRMVSFLYKHVIGQLVLGATCDTQCGLKAFRREAAEYLFGVGKISGFAFDIELVYLAMRHRMAIRYVPVETMQSDYSTVSVLRHGPRMILDALSVPVRRLCGGYPPFFPKSTKAIP